ncbi:MAG: OsmC family protein [Myxococcales bacterium]|nr:OsmC family protein [Myxococcales bacterium]
MQDLPHLYAATARAQSEGEVTLDSEALPPLQSAAPAQFGGAGDKWSPETLLVAAVADCFVLTFRGIARASKLAWRSLECEVEGTLDRVEKIAQFTEMRVRASLRVPPETDRDRARRLLERAEHSCLITQSLKAQSRLEVSIEIAP